MSALEWTIAQALEGGSIEAQLQQLREKFELTLGIAHDEVETEWAKVKKIHESVDAGPDPLHFSDVSLEDLWSTARVEFLHLGKASRRAEQVLTAYGLRHGLPRAPMMPQTFENMSLLGLLIVLETVLNAGFFNNAYMVAGPVQALLAAALISLTNVATSTAGGYFIGRWLNFGRNTSDPDDPAFKRKRTAARTGLILFIGLMALFHLTVGLIRAQETLHNIEHSPLRYMEILTTPEALFLVMFGSVMSAVSWRKGMIAFDDPYPGYGERQRCVDQAHDLMASTFEALCEQMKERFEEKRDELEIAQKAMLKDHKTYNEAVESYFKSHRKLEREIREAESHIRSQAAQIVHHHRSVRGKKSIPFPDGICQELASFDKYRVHDSPSFMVLPNFSAIKADLTEAQSKSLDNLTVLFEQLSTKDTGERP